MLATIFACALSVAAVAQAPAPDPRENIDTALKEGIRLLEAKERVTFLKQFMHPDDLKKNLKDTNSTFEEFAAKFNEEKAVRLLAVLKVIKDQKPELSEDSQQAVFKVEKEQSPSGRIVFQKSGKYWYIRN